jgi:putative hydrolase of the HAD superfamily
MVSFIFDIGGVLVSYDAKKVVQYLTEKTGRDVAAIDRLFQHELLYQVETGRISCAEFYEKHVRPAIPDISYENWVQVFIDHFEVNTPAMNLLLKVKNSGRKVYILSNLAEFHKIAIERKIPGFFDICDINFLSYELGYHKPEKEIFEAVCKRIGEQPGNCVFFDDMPANVEGAVKAGILALQYSNDRIDLLANKVEELLAI